MTEYKKIDRYIGSVEENDYYLKEDPDSAFSVEEIATLRAIKTGEDITSLVLGRTSEDDHELCIELTVNGVEFSALWIVPEFYADVIYAGKGHPDAKNEVANYIKGFFE